MMRVLSRALFLGLLASVLFLSACASPRSAATLVPNTLTAIPIPSIPPGFVAADGSRTLTFPEDFGAHPDFRTEWWYYTGNLQAKDGRHFGFELTIFRVGLVPPTAELPGNSRWASREIYFAHFAISDIDQDHFYAFQRYSRAGPGLAGAQADPYRVWLEDWNISESTPGAYRLQAEQDGVTIDLTLVDEMGVVLHGDQGYSRKGRNPTNASYYYSQPRLRADGALQINGAQYQVTGLVWNDHEFSTGQLDENQIGWDWFSLQFDEGPALMLFQLRQHDGEISDTASGTFISAGGTSQALHKSDFDIAVLGQWQSPHSQGIYPSVWKIELHKLQCVLQVQPWMADQEINIPSVTYWEGAVHFEGHCNNAPVNGNGYIELTGYAGSLPIP